MDVIYGKTHEYLKLLSMKKKLKHKKVHMICRGGIPMY